MLDANTPEADFLEATADIIRQTGGWVNPQARVIPSEDGASAGLGIACPAEDEAPLLLVPGECFLPIGEIPWADGPRLELTGPLPDLPPRTVEMLFVQIGLHNQRNAVARIASDHPQLAPGLDQSLIESVRRFRHRFRVEPPTPTELFWSNRCFRFTSTEGITRPMAVPIVDLLNHRDGAGLGSLHGEGFFVTVDHRTGEPHRDAGECFLDYGRQRDAIGMAIVYGFCDEQNPRAHSAPMTLEDSALGEIVIEARGRDRSGSPIAVRGERTARGIRLTHLTFDRRRGLAASIVSLAETTGLSVGVAEQVIHAVAGQNIAMLEELTAITRAGEQAPAVATLAGAARVQHQTITHVLSS